jgi:hypothetical protein
MGSQTSEIKRELEKARVLQKHELAVQNLK